MEDLGVFHKRGRAQKRGDFGDFGKIWPLSWTAAARQGIFPHARQGSVCLTPGGLSRRLSRVGGRISIRGVHETGNDARLHGHRTERASYGWHFCCCARTRVILSWPSSPSYSWRQRSCSQCLLLRTPRQRPTLARRLAKRRKSCLPSVVAARR